MKPFKLTLIACALSLASLTSALAQSAEGHPDWPGPGQLFAGVNYQPVDRTLEQVKRVVALMKQSGFKVVRMGDLAWDYFEPSEGRFDFKHFDAVMDEMHAAGIQVILDIPGLPAPMWLHHKYPGVDIVNQAGTRLAPAERYMDNIGDPDYRRLAVRMADTLTRRYAKHPALLAVGYDNEIGNGFMSYSEADRKRFVAWLKKRYGSIDALNKAWATQRWSRRIGSCPMPTARAPPNVTWTCGASGRTSPSPLSTISRPCAGRTRRTSRCCRTTGTGRAAAASTSSAATAGTPPTARWASTPATPSAAAGRRRSSRAA
jgi:beta-galactosidase